MVVIYDIRKLAYSVHVNMCVTLNIWVLFIFSTDDNSQNFKTEKLIYRFITRIRKN